MLQLLPLCEDTGIKPESNACFWHPLFGWCKGEIDVRLLRLFTYVQKQLQCLWHPAFVKVFFSDVLEPNPGNAKKHSLKMKRPFLSSVCEMYLLILLTVKNFVSDILIGLGCNDTVVFKIWCFFKDTTMLDFEEIFGTKSYILILSLLSQMMLYMLNILDDFDLFEKQRSFKNEDLAEITMFLNNLLFRTIWEEKELSQFSHCQGLLLMLYNRDCKKHFCRKEHWILQGFKRRILMKELDSNTNRGLRMLIQLPHIFPHQKVSMKYSSCPYSLFFCVN
ncbi:Ubiquitin-protein ligase E3B [Geodia barretti]|nr:Ubiquitin-protein ligase E3B [Geodia barretti]